jgi:hypothetical protein
MTPIDASPVVGLYAPSALIFIAACAEGFQKLFGAPDTGLLLGFL